MIRGLAPITTGVCALWIAGLVSTPAYASPTTPTGPIKPGADLLVVAPDVYSPSEDGLASTTPVRPGGSASVVGLILNRGDKAAAGVKVEVKIPAYVTFRPAPPECRYDASDRVATCLYPNLTLQPSFLNPGEAGILLTWTVDVVANAPGPGAWNGSITASPTGLAEGTDEDFPTVLPKNGRFATTADVSDIHTSTNVDNFAILVGPAAAPAVHDASPPPGPSRAGALIGLGAAAVLVLIAMLVAALVRRRVSTR